MQQNFPMMATCFYVFFNDTFWETFSNREEQEQDSPEAARAESQIGEIGEIVGCQ